MGFHRRAHQALSWVCQADKLLPLFYQYAGAHPESHLWNIICNTCTHIPVPHTCTMHMRNSNSNSTFIALNLCQRADSKAQWTKHNSISISRDVARVMHHGRQWNILSETMERVCLVVQVCFEPSSECGHGGGWYAHTDMQTLVSNLISEISTIVTHLFWGYSIAIIISCSTIWSQNSRKKKNTN